MSEASYRYKAVDGTCKYSASEAYKKATELAKELSPINPISLGLALNYSVFYYEVINNHETACEIAKNTIDAASNMLDNVDAEENADAISILNLLTENLEMWKIEAEDS